MLLEDIDHLVHARLVAHGEQRGRELGTLAIAALDHLGERLESALGAAALAHRLERAVGLDAQHGLDIEQRTHETLGARAAAVLHDVLERVGHEHERGLAGELVEVRHGGLERLARVAHAAGLLDHHAMRHGGRATVPHAHRHLGVLGRDLGRVCRAGERRGDVDGEHRGRAIVGHLVVRVEEGRGRGLRAVRQLVGRGHLVVELLGRDVDHVVVRAARHEHVERDHLDLELGELVERDVAGAVRENLELVLHGAPLLAARSEPAPAWLPTSRKRAGPASWPDPPASR